MDSNLHSNYTDNDEIIIITNNDDNNRNNNNNNMNNIYNDIDININILKNQEQDDNPEFQDHSLIDDGECSSALDSNLLQHSHQII